MSDQVKVAFVTGASSGIGQATAEAFVRAGYATALVDRDVAAGEKTATEFAKLGDCTFIACDVTDDAGVERAVADTVSRFGRIDVAFNGAGIDGSMAPTADSTMDNFDRLIAVNVKGVWSCMRHQLRQMLAQGGGAIVNCSSTSGVVGVGYLPAYSASKHAVVGLTKSAAVEYMRSGIRVNAVAPGMVDTPMWQRSISPEMTEQLLANDPAGRLAKPAEIAQAVLWLASPAASFVNGHTLLVDGGFTAV